SIAWPAPPRRCSTSRWRISGSTSWWARGSEPPRSRWTCRRSPPSAPRPGPACCRHRSATASASSATSTSTAPRSCGRSSTAPPRGSRSSSTNRRRWRSPPGRGARRASPTGCCGGCGTGPRCEAAAGWISPPRRRRCVATRSTSAAWTDSTGPVSPPCAGASPAGRGARPPSPWRWVRRPRPWRPWSSRTWCARASCCAPRGGGPRRRRRGPIWASNRPRGRRAPPRCSAGSERVPILTPSLGGLRDLGGYSGAVSRPRRRRIRASSTGEGASAERNPVELLPLLLIFAVMMLPLLFLSSRQKKMQQKQLELVRQLGVGDEVRTHSGFFGLIVEAYDDVVVLESEDGTQTKWARQAIAQQVDPVDPEGEASDDLAEGEADDAGLPGVTVSEDTPAEDDPRRDRLWPRRAHHLLRAPPGPRSRGAAARRLPRAAPTVRHPEELRIMPARRIALAALAVLILLLGGGIGAGVSKGGWEPAPKLALDLEGGTQISLQAQSRDGSAIDSAAMEQARQIMSQRINAMGVAETEITVQGGTNIVIDVPGQLDQATSQAIRQTAAMSF